MQALLAQLSNRIGDVDGNATRAVEAIRAHPEVDIAVFPELFLSGYTYRDLDALARDPECEELARIARAAAEAETAVVVGFAERTSRGVANSVACIDGDGSTAAVYRKTSSSRRRPRPGSPRARSSSCSSWPGGGSRRSSASTSSSPSRRVRSPWPAPSCSSPRRRTWIRSSSTTPSRASRARTRTAARTSTRTRSARATGWCSSAAAGRSPPTGQTVGEASSDREELLVVPVAERGGFDPRTDYPRYVRPPLPVVSPAEPARTG
jgi:hypothetical protein